MGEIAAEADVVIVGSGPAGLTAAVYCARSGLDTLVIEGMHALGQLAETHEVENFPGFPEPVGGMQLMEAMRRQAQRAGARFAADEIESVDFAGRRKRLSGMAGDYLAGAVIVATGAVARWTGLPGESEYRRHGISACAVCDGSFFRGKEVAVIGGGDTALGDALYLAKICAKVRLVHRRDEFRAARALVERVLATENIECVLSARVAAFTGDGRQLTGVTLEGGRLLPADGAFVAIGHAPATGFLKGAIELDADGYVVARGAATSVPGVFAAGDCVDRRYRQAVVAAGAGAAAAIEAGAYLATIKEQNHDQRN